MNSELVPTPVVDKNGRLTTVHKHGTVAGRRAASFPAPHVPAVPLPSREDIISGIMDQIREMDFIFSEYEAKEIRSYLEERTPEFLSKAGAVFRSPKSAVIAGKLIRGLETPTLINEAVLYMPQMEYRGFWETVHLIKTLHGYYPGLPKADDYSEVDQSVQDRCLALLKVTCAARHMGQTDKALKATTVGRNNRDRAYVLRDERLISLLLEQPQRADEIVRIIAERGTAEFGVIHAVLNAESVALSDGTL